MQLPDPRMDWAGLPIVLALLARQFRALTWRHACAVREQFAMPALPLRPLYELLVAPDRRDPAAPAAFGTNPLARRQAAFDPARRPTDGAIMQRLGGVSVVGLT